MLEQQQLTSSSTAKHSTAQHSTAQHSTAVSEQYGHSRLTVSAVVPQHRERAAATVAEKNAEADLESPVSAASSASCLNGAFPHAAVGLSQAWQAPLVALQLLI